LSNGSSFGTASQWTTAYSNAAGWSGNKAYWGTIRYPDLNGDGRADVCGRWVNGIFCAISNGTAFGAPSYWSTGYSDAGGWGSSEKTWGTIQYPDLNGDGRSDVCGSNASLYCAVSNGSTLGFPTYWSGLFGFLPPAESYWRTIQYPDLDGDGKADVCGRATAGVLCAKSLGSTFAHGGFWTSNFSDYHGWGASPAYWSTLRFPDVSGDGKADFCGRSGSGISCAP
jgi:FG-GAP-like repeat